MLADDCNWVRTFSYIVKKCENIIILFEENMKLLLKFSFFIIWHIKINLIFKIVLAHALALAWWTRAVPGFTLTFLPANILQN